MINSKSIRIFSDKINFYIIKNLRDIPLKKSSLIAKLKKIGKIDDKIFENKIEKLKSYGFITEFSFNGITYFLLIKDFYILKIPPINIIKLVQYSQDFPKNIKSKYISEIKKFKSKLKKKELFDLEKEFQLLTLFLNPKLNKFLNLLKNGPILQKKLIKLIKNFDEFKKLMFNNDLIIEIQNGNEKWIILKSDIKFEIFFPEYLIDNINKALNEGRISKDLALKALSVLKWNYLKNEMPNKFKELRERIENKKKIIEFAEREGIDPKEHVKALIKLLKEIGDYDGMKYWKEKYLD
ncbi:MAG: hypothetical protein ACTSVV_05855 [Promethearchaeota archaeon]